MGLETVFNLETVFQEMIDRWPSPIVARTEIEVFTGGMMNEKYQANLDSAGKGPESFRSGRKVFYHVKTYVEWFSKRSEAIPRRVK